MFEIGAHSGTVSMVCAKKYGCKVFAYEPSPLNYRLLIENIRINQLEHLIFPYPLAITGDGRSIRMQESLTNSGASNIYGNERHPLIESVSLKDAISAIRKEGEFIQVILMDCEGTEFELLKNVKLLKGIPVFRGEFHQQYGDGNVDGLLERIKTVIPNSKPYLQKHVGIQI
jgi:FkbM family methyltransferase